MTESVLFKQNTIGRSIYKTPELLPESYPVVVLKSNLCRGLKQKQKSKPNGNKVDSPVRDPGSSIQAADSGVVSKGELSITEEKNP
jgi:hypothetical protein